MLKNTLYSNFGWYIHYMRSKRCYLGVLSKWYSCNLHCIVCEFELNFQIQMQCVGCVTYCTTLMMSLSSKGIRLLPSWMTRNGTTICEGSDEAVVNFLCLANCCYLIGRKMHGCLRHYSPESGDHPLSGSQNRTCYCKHGLVVIVLDSIGIE